MLAQLLGLQHNSRNWLSFLTYLHMVGVQADQKLSNNIKV